MAEAQPGRNLEAWEGKVVPRQLMDHRILRNGGSVQVYELGEYVGSISLRELCGIIRAKAGKHTSGEKTQEPPLESPGYTPSPRILEG